MTNPEEYGIILETAEKSTKSKILGFFEQSQGSGGVKTMDNANIANERRKILDGTYPSRVIQGRQNKHIPGTTEFQQKREQVKKIDEKNEPSILTGNAQEIINRYKGTGDIILPSQDNPYPKENIIADYIIGKYWVKSLQKYIDTNRGKIHYSSTGTHIVPKGNYEKGD